MDSVLGLGLESNRSSAVFRCRATRIPATIASTRLRPSSIPTFYRFRLLFVYSEPGFPTVKIASRVSGSTRSRRGAVTETLRRFQQAFDWSVFGVGSRQTEYTSSTRA